MLIYDENSFEIYNSIFMYLPMNLYTISQSTQILMAASLLLLGVYSRSPLDLKDGLRGHPARPRHVLLDEQPRVDEEQDRLHQLPLPVIHILQAYLCGLLYEWERYQDPFLTTAKKPHQEDHQVLNKEKRTKEEILEEVKDTGQES